MENSSSNTMLDTMVTSLPELLTTTVSAAAAAAASTNDTNIIWTTSFQASLRWYVMFFFSTIAVTGFVGNLLVILVVVFNKNMHSTTNLLIVNLATADLMFVIFCVPFTGVDYVLNRWPFGNLWCRTVQYLIVVTAYASIYTLVLMSVDRFLAVVHPIRSRMLRTEHFTKIAIFTLWAVVLTISMPVTVAHDVVVSTMWEGGRWVGVGVRERACDPQKQIQGQSVQHAGPECAANNKFIAFHHRHLVRCLEPMFHVSLLM